MIRPLLRPRPSIPRASAIAERSDFVRQIDGLTATRLAEPVCCSAESAQSTRFAVDTFSRLPAYEVQCACLAKIVDCALNGTGRLGALATDLGEGLRHPIARFPDTSGLGTGINSASGCDQSSGSRGRGRRGSPRAPCSRPSWVSWKSTCDDFVNSNRARPAPYATCAARGFAI
jgi:hypothetical protein